MTTLDTLYESLTQAMDDWQARGILADWYEEAGQQHAADSIRWMIRHKKRPYRPKGAAVVTFHWFNDGRASASSGDPESNLPEVVYRAMSGSEGLELVFRNYDSLRASDEDFHAGWKKAIDEGWNPDA